jgi:HTH-type transcriptional regulator/antitoxin HigA
MIIVSPKQFEVYKEKLEFLLKQICRYENDVPAEIINEYKQVSDAIIKYEAAYHPLPGRVSTIISDEILLKFGQQPIL